MKRKWIYLMTAALVVLTAVMNHRLDLKADEISWDSFGGTIYNTTNGLMSNQVSSIAQTSDGIVWIGTDAGLAAFDGNEFTEYGSFYHFDGINDMLITKSGMAWYATTTYGGAVNLGVRFHHFDDVSENSSNYATAITESEDGIIYVGTVRNMVSIAPEAGYAVTDLSDNGLLYVTSLAAGSDGMIAGTTANGDIFFMKSGEVVEQYENMFYGRASVAYAAGYYLVGTPGGSILIYDETNLEKAAELENPFGAVGVNKIHIDGEERIWLLTEEEIGYYQFGSEGFEQLDFSKAEFVNCVFDNFESGYTDMMRDYQGNYWITSSKRGVLLLRSSYFVNEFAQMELNNDTVNAVLEMDGNIYTATDSGLLIVDSESKSEVNNAITAQLAGKRVVDLALYRGMLTAAVYGEGIYVFSQEELVYTASEELVSRRINRLVAEEELYILTEEGYSVWDGRNIIYSADTQVGMYIANVTSILTGTYEKNGTEKTYVGSQGAGIYVFTQGELTDTIDENFGLPSKNIADLAAYENGFFIATDQGICYYNGKKVQNLERLPEELSEKECQELYIIDDTLYVVCTNALYLIPLEDLFYGDRDTALKYTYLDENAGFIGELTSGGHGFLSEDGKLFLPCGQRVYSVAGDLTSTELADYKLLLQNVKADGTSVEIKDGNIVDIGSDTEELSIYCSVLEFSNADPYVRYILHGVDSDFTVVRHSQLEEIVYEGLEGGSYSFWFQLLDDAMEPVDTVTLTINKENSFFENLWVRMAGLTMGFAILMWFVFKDGKKAFKEVKGLER